MGGENVDPKSADNTGIIADNRDELGRFGPGNQIHRLRRTKLDTQDYLAAIRDRVPPEDLAEDIYSIYQETVKRIVGSQDARPDHKEFVQLTTSLTRLLPFIVGKLPNVKVEEASDTGSKVLEAVWKVTNQGNSEEGQ